MQSHAHPDSLHSAHSHSRDLVVHIHTAVTCWFIWGTALVFCMNILSWRVTSSKDVAVPPVTSVGNSMLFNISREWQKSVGPQNAFVEKWHCKLLENGWRRLLEYRTIGDVAFACPISHIFCFIIKQSLLLKLNLLHKNTIETYSSCIHMLESLQMVAVFWDTGLHDVKFSIPSFKVCAFDGQFGEHSLLACLGLCAVGLHFSFLLSRARCRTFGSTDKGTDRYWRYLYALRRYAKASKK